MKGIWKDYFSFTKKERIAVAILLLIIGVFSILPYFFSKTFTQPFTDTVLQQQLLSLNKQVVDTIPQSEKPNSTHQQDSPHALFYFDPNSLDSAGWQRLGLKNKTIKTILNYRNKGGSFKTAEEIRKIYGLRKEDADKLIPYIQIKSSETHTKQASLSVNSDEVVIKASPIQKKININSATAEEWKALPGIGDVLSNRIVKFRNALHGFRSVEDIRKTYGLSDSTYQLILPYLTISDSAISKN